MAVGHIKTILLSDLVQSTRLVERLGDVRAAELFARHDDAARSLLPRYEGREIDKSDGFLLLFERPIHAVGFALAYHDVLAGISAETGVPLNARVGLHVGEVILREMSSDAVSAGAKPIDIEGLTKVIAARLMHLAAARQTLLTRASFDLSRQSTLDDPLVARAEWRVHPTYRLTGISEPIEVCEVGLAGFAPLMPPPDSDKAKRVGSGRPGILVMPFSDLSVNRDAGHVSDGLTDEIITTLSSVPTIRVISRGASMQLKDRPRDAGDLRSDLNVEYVLEGTVRRSNGTLRITAQLARTDDSEVLWAHKYTGMIADLFDIEEQIARTVVEGLSIKLGQKEEQRLAARPVPDAAAYEHYLRAKHAIYRFTEEALDEALVYLEKGLALLGDNIPLSAAMGYVYWQYVNAGIRPDPVYLEKAVTCADRILEMDPDASEGHRLKGLVAIHAKGDIQETVRHLKRAADRDPNNTDTLFWLALFYGFAGRPSSGHPLAERLLELDPITPFHWLLPGYLCILEGDFARARPQMQKAYDVNERSAPVAQSYAQLLLMAGDESAARTVVAQMGEDDPESFFTKLGQCFIAAIDGTDVDPAIMAEVRDGAQADAQYSWSLAACYALRGHADLAIDWLTNSVRRGNWNYPLIAERDPLLASLRTDDRFTTLMREVRQKWLSFEV